jgi:hypothetical protein
MVDTPTDTPKAEAEAPTPISKPVEASWLYEVFVIAVIWPMLAPIKIEDEK